MIGQPKLKKLKELMVIMTDVNTNKKHFINFFQILDYKDLMPFITPHVFTILMQTEIDI